MSAKRILLAENLDHPLVGMDKNAAAVAETFGADLDIAFIEEINLARTPQDLDVLLGLRERRLNEMTRIRNSMHIGGQDILRTGATAEELLKLSEAKPEPEMVIMGTRGYEGVKRLILGSVANEVLRHCTRPVMVFGPKVQNYQWPKRPIKILLATDLSEGSEKAESYCKKLAAKLGAKVRILHSVSEKVRSVQESIYMSGMMAFDLEQTFGEIKKESTRLLDDRAKDFREQKIDCDICVDDRWTNITDAVLEKANEGYDLVVLGTRGRNMLAAAIVGSTARKLILNATVPVLVVHS